MKGSYVLLIEVERPMSLRIGSLGLVHFRKGFYAYVGSAMNSLEKRIERHTRKQKKKFWHIDYLLERAKLVDVVFWVHEERRECEIANAMAKIFGAVPNFGSSDCMCKSHLFYSEDYNKLKNYTKKILRAPRLLSKQKAFLF